MLRTVRVRVFSVLTAGVWPCVSWKEKGFGVSDASQVPEQLGSGSKKLTPKNVLLGLQHVLVSNVWLDPVFVAGAIGLPLALSSNMVNAIFIVSGLVTLIQATRLVRLPIVQGPSAAFDALMIAAGTAGSLAAAGTSIFVGSLIFLVLCLTRVIEKMRFLFAPIVSGVIIFLVGVSLSSFTLSEFLGGAPGDDGFADPKTLAVSIVTCVLVVALSQFGKGMVRALSYLIALVAGTALSMVFGMADFSGVASKPWFGLPQIMPYGGFDFDAAVFVPFFIAYMVAIMEALGVYQAASEIQGVKLEDRQVRYGLAGEAAGSAISSMIGGFTTTAYPQNVALLKVTDEGKTRTRVPVIIAGVVFVVLGFIPKAGAVLSLIPSPVIGGIFLPAAASLISTGFNTLRKVESNDRSQAVIGLSLLLGIALPSALSGLEGGAHVFFSNSILVGAFCVVILKALLIDLPNLINRRKGNSEAEVPSQI